MMLDSNGAGRGPDYARALACVAGEASWLEGEPPGVADVSAALANTGIAAWIDWRVSKEEGLRAVAALLPTGWFSEVTESGTSITIAVAAPDLTVRTTTLQDVDASSNRAVISVLVSLCPGFRAYEMVQFQAEDTAVYVLVTDEQDACLREALGQDWGDVFTW